MILALLTVARIATVMVEKPSPQEAYYYVCSQQPAGAYYDGPPGTALLVGALAKLGGPDYVWRLSAPLWALIVSVLVFYLGKWLLDEKAGILAALALNALPVFNVEALRVGPWLPALTLGVAALTCAWRGFEESKKPLGWWLATAVLLGCAVQFDYRAIVLFPAIAAFILSSAKHRKPVDFAGVAAMLVIPLLMLIPAFLWNAQKDWIPIAGGTFQTLWSFNLEDGAISLVGVMYFLSPILFIMLMVSTVLAARMMKTRIRARFIFLAAGFPVLMGFYSLLRDSDAVFYFLLASPLLLARAAQACLKKPWRALGAIALVVAVALSCHTIYYTVQGAQTWANASGEVRKLFLDKLAEGQSHVFLIAEDAPMASVLGYYLKGDLIPPGGHPPVYVRESQAISSQYGLWPSYDDFVEVDKPSNEYFQEEQRAENPFLGRDALYVTSEKADDVPQTIKAAFESVTLLKTYPMGGDRQEPLYIYLCLNYQTLPL